MDFNDLKNRLSRTLASLNLRFEENIEKNINYETTVTETSTHINRTTTVFFGNDSLEVITNKIFIILHNLSSLKDHLKNSFKNKGLDPNIVEVKINSSSHLQVLIDIVNQEKHGYPLTKSNRSNKNPVLKNISQVLRVTDNNPPPPLESGLPDFSKIDFTKNFIAFGHDRTIEHSGDIKIVIQADIFDDKNICLFTIDELVDTCFSEFEELIVRYSII